MRVLFLFALMLSFASAALADPAVSKDIELAVSEDPAPATPEPDWFLCKLASDCVAVQGYCMWEAVNHAYEKPMKRYVAYQMDRNFQGQDCPKEFRKAKAPLLWCEENLCIMPEKRNQKDK